MKRRRIVPRWIHRVLAKVGGYFWSPCPECGEFFGGHERSHVSKYMPDGSHLLVCPRCAPVVYRHQVDEIVERLGLRKKNLP